MLTLNIDPNLMDKFLMQVSTSNDIVTVAMLKLKIVPNSGSVKFWCKSLYLQRQSHV